MWLTGHADGAPLLAPAGVVSAMQELAGPLDADVLSLLCERAVIAGSTRRGTTSCGGRTRLLRAADGGWVAVSLVRPDDVALLPAWLDVVEPQNGEMDDHSWNLVGAAVGRRGERDIVDRAAMLGLPVAGRSEVTDDDPVASLLLGPTPRLERSPVVVDLSSLWAGPLTTRLLQLEGARVIKVESLSRPDGARRGPQQFFDLMNAGKESVALDFQSREDVERLRELLGAADVVVEASRPRALRQLGIDACEILADGPRIWVSITGFGRCGPGATRVAFGDDAAIAGGLTADTGDGPCFVADAVADPLTGVTAAAAVQEALQRNVRVLLDVALARVAARVARAADGERWREADPPTARRPRLPAYRGRGPELGANTAAVLREFLG